MPASGKSTGFINKVLFTEQPEEVVSGYDADFQDLAIAEAEQIRSSKELFVDHTTTYQKYKVYTLIIEHVPTGLPVTFKAMLTRFEDQFTSNWNSQSVYGRMDDIHTFQNTKRSMNVGFVVPAFDAEDARCNLSKIASLAQKLYPKYSGDASNVSTISNAPLLRIKFANFIRDARTSGGGLLGKTNGFSFAPVLEDGFFDYPNLLYPKTINVNFTFDVLHEHVVGWGDTEKGETKFGVTADGIVEANAFPYVRGKKLPSNTISFDEARDLDEEADKERAVQAENLEWEADMMSQLTPGAMRRNIRRNR